MHLFNSRGPRSQSKSISVAYSSIYVAWLVSNTSHGHLLLFYFAEKFF